MQRINWEIYVHKNKTATMQADNQIQFKELTVVLMY